MSEAVLGIDLGTTNSVVAVADEGGVRVLPDAQGERLIPSVVSFHPSREILVGRAARDRRMLDAPNTVYSVKRLIGRPYNSEEVRRAIERFPFELREGPTGGVLVAARGETYTLSEISAFVLRQVRAQGENALGQPCSKAVVTVPANFNELQRSATKAAGRVAGLEVLRILNEPTAAALAYGYGRGSRERIAIFDLGGGTFDITILELAGDVFEVLATAGDTYLGGDDIDTLVAEQMAEVFLAHHRYDPRSDAQAFERLRVAAEWAKCQLTAEEDVQVRVEELAYGPDGVPLDLTFGMTRQALDQSAQPLIARAFDVCEDAMRVAAVRPTQLDNVILVGGATRMPLVRRMVCEYFGKEPLANIDPDLVVAQGAAIQARTLSGHRPAPARALGRVALKKRTLAEVQAADDAATAREEQREHRPPSLPAVVDETHAPPPTGQPLVHDETTAVRRSSRPGDLGDEDDTAVARSRYAERSAEPPPPPPPPPAPLSPQGAPPSPPPPPPAVQMAGSIAIEGDGGASSGAHAPMQLDDPGGAGVAGPPLEAERPPSAPLLLDVTPQSLGVETVGGYCEHIIKRNAAIPVEQNRTFSTARDGQETVSVKICQGESRRLDENQLLGEIQLTGLRAAPRGQVQVGVTFMMGADGTLDVRATDLGTGREQSVRINLIGGMDDEQVQDMQQRHEQRFRPS